MPKVDNNDILFVVGFNYNIPLWHLRSKGTTGQYKVYSPYHNAFDSKAKADSLDANTRVATVSFMYACLHGRFDYG